MATELPLEVQLSEAIKLPDLVEVRRLLEAGVQPEYEHLELAIRAFSLEAVAALVERGAPLSEKGRSAMFDLNSILSCIEAYNVWEERKAARLPTALAIARCLVTHGADVNLVAGFSEVPPMHAALQGFIEVADLLHEHGATLPPKWYWAAKSVAAYDWLKKHGVDLVNARDPNGRNLLELRFNQGPDVDTVRFLLEEGLSTAGLNRVDGERTHLQAAVAVSGARALPALDLVLPRLGLSDEERASLADAAEEPEDRAALAAALGVRRESADPLDPETVLSAHGRARWQALLTRIAELERALSEHAPALAEKVGQYIAPGLTRATVDRLREELIACFGRWSSANQREPLAAIVFEWAGHSVVPYDAGALAAGYGRCDLAVTPPTLAAPRFASDGSLDLRPALGAIVQCGAELAAATDATRSLLDEYLALRAAALMNLALGLAVESPEFAAVPAVPPMAFFVREHDHAATLAFVFPG